MIIITKIIQLNLGIVKYVSNQMLQKHWTFSLHLAKKSLKFMMKSKNNFKKKILMRFQVIMYLLIKMSIRFRINKKKIHFFVTINIFKKSNIYKSKVAPNNT